MSYCIENTFLFFENFQFLQILSMEKVLKADTRTANEQVRRG